MSNELITTATGEESRETGSAIAQVSEKSRVLAEVQAAVMMARQFPRDEKHAMDRVLTACQRVGLARQSQYSFQRGGSEICRPSIKLLQQLAAYWGNIQYGFRELERKSGESIVEVFAVDLESNVRRVIQFSVPHRFNAGGRIKSLTDPRDIYEHVANQAQRRVRACLESVIPADVIEAAMEQCTETLKAADPVTPEAIKKLTEAFATKYGVSKEQIEQRLGRRIESITPAQLVNLRRIWRSLEDGMSEPRDWFQPLQEDAPEKSAGGNKSLKEKLKGGDA